MDGVPSRHPRVATASTAGLTPKEVLAILRRHVLLIVCSIILGLISGGAGWFLLLRYLPEYTARTFVRVLPPVEKDPTAIQAALVGKDVQYGHRWSMAALLKSQNTLQQLLERDKVRRTKWFQSFAEIEDERIVKAVRKLEKHLGASPQRDGDFIVVSMTCHDKEESALIVNEMVDLFLNLQGSKKKEGIAARLRRLEEQQVRVQRDVDSAEDGLDDVKIRWGFTDLEERSFRPVIEEKLANLEREQNDLVMNIRQLTESIERLRMQATGPVQVQVERQVEHDPVMTMLAQQLAMRESALASALARFGEDHRVVRQIREFIRAIEDERQLRKATIADQTRRANLRNAQDALVSLEGRLEEWEKMREETTEKKKELDLARAQYQQRVAIRDERRGMLDSIKEQIGKLRILHDDPETPKVQFAGYAPEPLEVSFPKWKIFFPGGTIFGLMLGVGLAFLIELVNDLVRTPKDVARHLHIPLLGMIPDATEDPEVEGFDLALIARQAPYSIITESYRRFRINLRLSISPASTKVLLVTSGIGGEGSTSAGVNLATTLVADGKRVLLIDANFRRPTLHELFPRQQATGGSMLESVGLSTVLMGKCNSSQAVRGSVMEGLDVIDAGPLPPNPAELIGSGRMEQLIKEHREKYDYVIVDGPPVLLVSETKLLARCADGTILVFNAALTRRGAAQRTIRELQDVGAEIVGCVLFGVRTLKGGYFRELFKSYQEYQRLQLARPI